MPTFSSTGGHIRVNSTALLNCISYRAGAQQTVWGEVFNTGRDFIFIPSLKRHCGRQSHHTNTDSVASQSGTAMLSYKCLILIHILCSPRRIQHLSKQNTFPHDRPFFGTLTSLGRQKWNFSMGTAQLLHYLKVTITQD